MSGIVFAPAGLDDVEALHGLVTRAYRGDAARLGWTHEADLLDGQRTDVEALTAALDAPTGEVTAEGTLAGAPVALALRARREADGTLHATIDRAEWRSLHAEGGLRLAPGATPLTRALAERLMREALAVAAEGMEAGEAPI